MPHKHLSWIVIADGEHARFVKAGSDPHFHTVETCAGGSNGGHGGWSHQDPHDTAKHTFAKRLAMKVDALVAQEVFDELFLVAPAHVLKDVRDHLGQAARAKLKACIQKDLAKVPDGDLAKHFPDWPLVLAA
jgi:protein required for attachment to host cells